MQCRVVTSHISSLFDPPSASSHDLTSTSYNIIITRQHLCSWLSLFISTVAIVSFSTSKSNCFTILILFFVFINSTLHPLFCLLPTPSSSVPDIVGTFPHTSIILSQLFTCDLSSSSSTLLFSSSYSSRQPFILNPTRPSSSLLTSSNIINPNFIPWRQSSLLLSQKFPFDLSSS